MVYVQMTEMAQLCVHVTVTGRVVNVNVSLFRVLYEVITIANICLYYTHAMTWISSVICLDFFSFCVQ
jgi:hypothetical protein